MVAEAEVNGQPPPAELMSDRAFVQDVLLGGPLTTGYRPTQPLWAMWTSDAVPQFYLLRDVELMLIHPVVRNALNYYKAGLTGAEFEVTCGDPLVGFFIHDQCERFWDKGVPYLQGGYEYGWIACENIFREEDDLLLWDSLLQFSPRDVYLLTIDAVPVGVRVKQIRAPAERGEAPNPLASASGARGYADLWLASSDVPAKGLWYAHAPRHSQFYGVSQLTGAWKPWRRLAWKDGAETVIDGGVYRFAYSGPIVYYPEQDAQAAAPGTPNTTLDSQGRPRRYARDVARQMAEWYKAGAGIGLPSGHYSKESGGGRKWEFEIPTSTLNVNGLIDYAKHLQELIAIGIGVPPELLQAAETGSGYSGRAIPLEGFLREQQQHADNLLGLFDAQVLKPMIAWNFGPMKYQVKVKNLLETKMNQQQKGKQGSPQPGGGGLGGEQRQAGAATPAEAPPGMNPMARYNPNWQPYSNPADGRQGWISDRGRVVYADNPPGLERRQELPGAQFSLSRQKAREAAMRLLKRGLIK